MATGARPGFTVLRLLRWLYLSVYLATGAALVAAGWVEAVSWVWAPFGAVLAAFHAAVGREGRFARVAAGAISALVTATLPWAALGSALVWLAELAAVPEQPLLVAFWVLTAAAVALALHQTVTLARALAGERRPRGLVRLVLVPSIACPLAAASAGVTLALTPELPHVFLEGLAAAATLAWCALVTAWLAGAWLVALAARARLRPDPVPPARAL